MKSKQSIFLSYGCLTVTCFMWLSVLGLSAQTVDIADFLLLEPANEWYMEGHVSLTYSGVPYSPEVAASIKTYDGGVLHGIQTTKMELQGVGSVFIVIFNVEFSVHQKLWLSLDDEGLFLHQRIGEVYAAGNLEDLDEEYYIDPAKLLPRLITAGTYYPLLADTTTGSVQDLVYFEGIETIETSLGPVDALKLVLFAEREVPVTLWLGRNIGCTKMVVDTTFDSNPLNLDAILTGMNIPWDPSPIDGLWAATFGSKDGWRYADWLASFWAPSVESPWIYHNGFAWTFCLGDPSSLWMYIHGLGWLWTNEVAFPGMYDADAGRFLYYIYEPGSFTFYDVAAEEYIDLTP